MDVDQSVYSRVDWFLDLGSYGRVLEAVRELEDQKVLLEATVLDLIVFLKQIRQDLVDGDFEWTIADLDQEIAKYKALGFNPVEEEE